MNWGGKPARTGKSIATDCFLEPKGGLNRSTDTFAQTEYGGGAMVRCIFICKSLS